MIAVYVFGLSTQILALSVLIGGLYYSLPDILLLIVMAAVLSFLLRYYRAQLSDMEVAGIPLGAYLFAGVASFFIFRLAPVHGRFGAVFWLEIGALCAASVSVFFVHSRRGMPDVVGKKAFLIAAGLALISFMNSSYSDLSNRYGVLEKWSSGLFWIFMSVNSVVVPRFFACAPLRPWIWRFFVSIVAVSSIIAATGVVRGVTVCYHYYKAIESFAEERYEEFGGYVNTMMEEGGRIGINEFVLGRVMKGMVGRALMARDLGALVFLGEVAARNELWPTAKLVYKQAGTVAPEDEGIRSGYHFALSATGYNVKAIESLLAVQGEGRLSAAGLANLIVLQARIRDLLAVRGNCRDLYYSTLDPLLFGAGQDIVYANRGDIFPDTLFPGIIGRISLYEVVRILEASGGRVFHPATEIGTTGLVAPVDIEVFSGGGNTWVRENIWVAGQAVSPNERGYNVAVVHPTSGRVLDVAVFDTWEKISEGMRLAEYLGRIEYGHIVVGTIRDEGTNGLVAKAKEEMSKLGVRHSPSYWGSHGFIGLKGAVGVRIVEAFGEEGHPLSIGVLGPDTVDLPVGNQDLLVEFLRKEARIASGGFAVYMSGLDSTDTVVVARRPVDRE